MKTIFPFLLLFFGLQSAHAHVLQVEMQILKNGQAWIAPKIVIESGQLASVAIKDQLKLEILAQELQEIVDVALNVYTGKELVLFSSPRIKTQLGTTSSIRMKSESGDVYEYVFMIRRAQ